MVESVFEWKEGDKVQLLLPSSTNKLSAKWQGPYTVTKRMGKVLYMPKGEEHLSYEEVE